MNSDINDGVRLNIRPLVKAGVLRKNPKLDWKKDCGKDPPDAPCGEERVNDLNFQTPKGLGDWTSVVGFVVR